MPCARRPRRGRPGFTTITGLAFAPDGSLYVSNNSSLPAHTPKKSPFEGHGGEILKITGF